MIFSKWSSGFCALLLVAFSVSAQVERTERAVGVSDAGAELTGFPDRPEDADKQAWATLKMAVTEAKLVAGDAAQDDLFGYSVSLSGDRALVGAYADDDAGSFSGSAYVFELGTIGWTQTAKLVAADAAANDRFGTSVSLLGDRALVGARFDDDTAPDSGSAYVFDFSGTDWVETKKLVAGDAAVGDLFGWSVSLSGNRALVGAYRDDDAGSSSGSAYVFDFNGTDWVETKKLVAADAAAGDEFAYSVSLSGDRALVGAWFHDDAGGSSGSAYVFDFNGTDWVQTKKLVAADAAAGDRFGTSVSLSGDRALVGAQIGDSTAPDSGSAYVFDFNGTDWVQTKKLVAADAAASDFFGWSVSLSGDRGLVGAFADDDAGSSSGSAYVFDFNGTDWVETKKLVATDAAAADVFAYSVSLSGDRALVGAFRDDDTASDSGSAYVFALPSTMAVDDAYAVNEGNLLGVSTATGLLANDTGVVPSALEVTLIDGQPVVGIDYAPTGGGTLSVAADGSLSFDTGQDFEALEDGETATVTFSYSISDGFGTDTATVTITVNGRDDTLIAQDDVFTTLEDRAVAGNLFADNGNGIDFGGEADEMLVTTAGNFEASGIGGTVTITENGDFTYTPAADAFGEATFDYTVADTILSDTATVTITVEPINDAPSFVVGPDQLVSPSAPSFQSITGWATGITAGPSEENQVVRFRPTTTADPDGVLSGDVAITQDGELRFTLTGNEGTAEIEVELRDDGGTDAGGANTSDAEAFFITVVDNTQVILRRTDTSKWHMYLLDGFTKLSNGNRPFSPNPAWTTQAIEDFNGDGVRDLLVRNSSNGQWHLYYLNGATGQPDFSRHIGVSNDPDDVFQGAGDLNGDGFGDVLTRSASTGEWQAWYFNGSGYLAFTQPLAITTDANVETQALGDFDGNGTADLLLRDNNRSWSTVSFVPGSGEVISTTTQVITRNVLWQPEGVGDFDGDGREELLLRRTDDNRWITYTFDATGAADSFGPLRLSPQPEWTLQWIDDFDGDGNEDALLRRTDNNVWNLYLLGPNRQILDSGRVPLTPNLLWQTQ